ncbi:MAG: hypothetical protein VB118_12975 [Oscillospiraceae bacterium]|nr:hypothetical protein [Oscillospiraceae bacterium]
MKNIKRIGLLVLLVTIFAAASVFLIMVMENKTLINNAEQIKSDLFKDSYSIDNISFKKDEMISVITSLESDSIGPNEILALRAIRNNARSTAMKNESFFVVARSLFRE